MWLVTEENVVRYTNCEMNIFKWILKSKAGFDVINWYQNFYQRHIWSEGFSFPPNIYTFLEKKKENVSWTSKKEVAIHSLKLGMRSGMLHCVLERTSAWELADPGFTSL